MNAKLNWLSKHLTDDLGADFVTPGENVKPNTAELPDLHTVTKCLIQFSGGKDSLACVEAMEQLYRAAGLDPHDHIELWHQCIDGDPRQNGESFMDWGVTEAYCRAYAKAKGYTIRFQWKHGGFYREMNRNEEPTAPTSFELPNGTIGTIGGKGKNGTRRKFPQVTANLTTRWCSSYLKIDVCTSAICNDPRFKAADVTVLVVTGERWQESSARATYAQVDHHKASTKKRTVIQYRPVLNWNEGMVWASLREAGVNAHPCYEFGYSRASCAMCIFGGKNEWATMKAMSPQAFDRVADKEAEYGVTIKRNGTVRELADKGESMVDTASLPEARRQLMGHGYEGTVLVDPADWKLPSGAFRHTAGPC